MGGVAVMGGPTMSCPEVDRLLAEYVEGTLEPALHERVRDHLAACPACRSVAEEASLAVQFLQRVPELEVPPALLTSVLFHTSAELARRRGGLAGWLRQLVEPVMQPRFAMGMAMTILSLSLAGQFALGPERPRRWADLHPARIWAVAQARAQRSWDAILDHYNSLRLVWEIRNRLEEWSEERESSGQASVPPPAVRPSEEVKNP